MKTRGSGVLLHVSSLPSPFGVGDLGPAARRFVDFLAAAGQIYWQILPLNPTDPLYDNSPYHSISAFAFNPLFISPELLVRDGFLTEGELEPVVPESASRAEYEKAIAVRARVLPLAFERWRGAGVRDCEYERFIRRESWWLEDFSLFQALKAEFGARAWVDWPPELRDRHPEALEAAHSSHADRIALEKFAQYIFYRQWTELKQYASERGVHIIGDLPIYVDADSVDLWSHPHLFKLDGAKRPWVVAGVPPDYFSATGQLWGNPVYNWEALRAEGFRWWIDRIRHNLRLFDRVRIDHFRGLVACWEIQAGAETAVSGRWVEAPVNDFLGRLARSSASLPIIAEDLGLITPDVREAMSQFGLPGMKVLLFAFGGDTSRNPYIPHNVPEDCIYYTGTHDNNTARGWFETETGPSESGNLNAYLGRETVPETVAWDMIRLVLSSRADTAILPLQDILGLPASARMNVPSTAHGNWRWRCSEEHLCGEVAGRLLAATRIYGRG